MQFGDKKVNRNTIVPLILFVLRLGNFNSENVKSRCIMRIQLYNRCVQIERFAGVNTRQVNHLAL
jgi:hypothetical protein